MLRTPPGAANFLALAIEAAGGTLCLRRGVEEILVENGRAVGVRTEPGKDGPRETRAKVVLSNADLKHTLLDLLPREHLPSALQDRVESFQMGGAIFMTYLGVTADMASKGMGASNYWQFDDYDVEGFYRDNREGHFAPKGAYITSASFKDPDNPDHAPPGVTNVEVMGILPGDAKLWGVEPSTIEPWSYKRSPRYQELKARIEENLIDRLERVFPGTKETIVFKESASPVTHTRYTRAAAGTGYGIAATPGQFLQKRPGYRGPIPGLYLCGASTRAGHGVFGTLLSGHSAAVRIAEELGRPLEPLFK